MRFVMSALLAIAVAASVPLLATRSVAYAAFHCVRIHAVAGGYNADGNIQYVELRMDMGGQTLLGGHALQFFDAAGTLKATFTFPSGVANGAVGDSVLIATSQFNSNVTGGPSDFTFTNANTTGANGGDPLHPVQAPNGSVVWAGPSAACVTVMAPVDSVAYGSASAVYGSAAVALPNPGTLQALRLSNLNSTPSNNSTEYALTNVSTATFGVAPSGLATDFTTPRNNTRNVLRLNRPLVALGGLDEDAAAAARTGIASNAEFAIAAAAAAAVIAGGAGLYGYRRRGS